MKIKRELLIHHLQRIICDGQITEAVFEGTFGTTAITPSHQLLVIAPKLPKPKTALFKDPVGIAELGFLVKALAVLAGTGNEAVDVNIKLENHRLVIDDSDKAHHGTQRLLTAAPKTIGTHLEDSVIKALVAKAPKGDQGIPLTRELVEAIKSIFTLYKATEVELFIGPTGGKVQVGNEHAHIAGFDAPDLKAPGPKYNLLFGSYFVDVLGVITNFNEVILCLGGTGKFVMIADGGYKYILAPMARSKDAE